MAIYQNIDLSQRASHSMDPLEESGRKPLSRVALTLGLLLLDAMVIFGTPALLSLVSQTLDLRYDAVITMAIVPVYIVIAINNGAYAIDALEKPIESVRRAFSALLIAQITVFVSVFFINQATEVSRLWLATGALTTLLAVVTARGVFGRFVWKATKGRLRRELIVLDGGNVDAQSDGIDMLDAQKSGLRPNLNDPEMLHRFGVIARNYDRILIASAPERQAQWARLLKGADIQGEILVSRANWVGAIGISSYRDRETLIVSRKPLSIAHRIHKRILDLTITIPVLIVLLPLLALIAVAIKLDSPGPVLFKQARIGRGNCQFKVLKFRSMRSDLCDADGTRSASQDDDRITRVGRFIRGTSLDELPQLLNVLIGDMSLVGPRPHALGSLVEKRLFWEVDQTYWHRHQLKPGITGLAQIRGYRGATRQTSDLTDRLQADMEYVQGWDIWRDVGILISTFRVLVHKNAF